MSRWVIVFLLACALLTTMAIAQDGEGPRGDLPQGPPFRVFGVPPFWPLPGAVLVPDAGFPQPDAGVAVGLPQA